MTDSPSITFVGGGNMGRAMIAGLIAGGHEPSRISVADPNSAVRSGLKDDFGVGVFQTGPEAIADAALIVLAVKPQVMESVVSEMVDALPDDCAALSIAAGITIATIKEWMGGQIAVARAMPNTPALIGCGISGAFAGDANNQQRAIITRVLEAAGEVVWVDDEDQLHLVTAVSGSGPAYFFRVVEALQRAGEAHGLPASIASKLAAHTAYGAGRLLFEAGESASKLRERVTSPKGTTERGLAAMNEADIDKIMEKVVDAAKRRSVELGQGTRSN